MSHISHLPPIKLAEDTIDKSDITALTEWLNADIIPKLTQGELVKKFEEEYAERINVDYCVMVNSGSSANLLMLYALDCLEEFRNKKIVVPALSWATTVAPVIQLGYQPLFCDCNMQDLSVDLTHLEQIFKESNPAALLLVSVLGLPPDMEAIIGLCDDYGVILLLDNCESQGAKFKGIHLENYALASTVSMYYGHNSACIEGGVISTFDEKLYDTLKMLRAHGWVRDVTDKAYYTNKWDISDFNQLYTFFYPGFNFRSTEVQAFLALRQLEKMDAMFASRTDNFLTYQRLLKNPHWKPVVSPRGTVVNLGYPLIHPKRDEIVRVLKENNIECRPLISGNMCGQPMIVSRYGRYAMPNAEKIQQQGMYLPNNHRITAAEIEQICGLVNGVIV